MLDVVYPAATIIADIARSQDAEVGDGTTSGEATEKGLSGLQTISCILVVLLACELLKNAKPFVEDGVNTQLIIRAYNEAAREVRFYGYCIKLPIRFFASLRRLKSCKSSLSSLAMATSYTRCSLNARQQR